MNRMRTANSRGEQRRHESAAARGRVLIVLHQEHSSPGRVGQRLIERGYALDVRRPRFGDPLPRTLADHAGAIIFGGPMSANDPDDFLRRETELIGLALREGAPFLGICLGAQMLVNHLGGRTVAHPHGHAEVGYYPLHPTPKGEALIDWPTTVYQWHREGVELPSGCELLARGDMFENQAFRYGPSAFGLQFHSELTYAMVCRWTVSGAHRFELPGTHPRARHLSDWHRYDPPVRGWLGRFLDMWLSLDARAKPSDIIRPGSHPVRQPALVD